MNKNQEMEIISITIVALMVVCCIYRKFKEYLRDKRILKQEKRARLELRRKKKLEQMREKYGL